MNLKNKCIKLFVIILTDLVNYVNIKEEGVIVCYVILNVLQMFNIYMVYICINTEYKDTTTIGERE